MMTISLSLTAQVSRIQEVKNYTGTLAELPSKLSYGDTYDATDGGFYRYDINGAPQEVGSGGSSAPVVEAVTESRVITAADNGTTFYLNSAMAGYDITIEEDLPTGTIFYFIIDGAVMSGHTIETLDSNNLFGGEIMQGGTPLNIVSKTKLSFATGDGTLNMVITRQSSGLRVSGFCPAGKVTLTP